MSHSDIRRTALITGSSRGLGTAIALEQATAGANVAVNYFRNEEAAERLCVRIQEDGGRAHAFKADVRDEGEVALGIKHIGIAKIARLDRLLQGGKDPGWHRNLLNLIGHDLE